MKGKDVVFSKKSDDWSTPPHLYVDLDKEFSFDFDPCPLNYKVDGLTIPWKGNIFINPPYSRTKEFLKKGIEELDAGNAKILVYLLPSRTDTKWFHEYLWDEKVEDWRPGVKGRFIKGRLKFGGCKDAAPFPSLIAVIK